MYGRVESSNLSFGSFSLTFSTKIKIVELVNFLYLYYMKPINYKDFFREELETEITDQDYSTVHGGKYGVGRVVTPPVKPDDVNKVIKLRLFNSKKTDIQTYSESEGREIGKNTTPAIDHSVHSICDHMKVKGIQEAEEYVRRCVARGAIYALMSHVGVKPESTK
jgi:hypothetical protein